MDPPAKLPAAVGDCVTEMLPSAPGAPPQLSNYKLTRASDGSLRVDQGNISILTDPTGKKSILLDHVNKEARMLSGMPGQPPMPGMPEMPHAPAMPAMPNVPQPPEPVRQFQDLGKKMLNGEEVTGKRLTIQPPQLPNQPPQPPTIGEIWTNPTLHLPVLTQVQGPFGQQKCTCKNSAIAEPHPSLFEIPPDYRQVQPPQPPQAPATPSVPSAPSFKKPW